ncbi:MAG: cupin domain-containing protein [Deltaproteobacteria bacterium]|nr:cupin domain-containing protein [Deltaproteobacteria bacterium]
MDERTGGTTYDSFREAAKEYGDVHGDDFLTDADAIRRTKEKAEIEEAISHGQNLRATRERQGFSLEELGAKTGIDPITLGQLEAGETMLPLGQLIKLSKALSLKMSDIISPGTEPFTIVRVDQRRSVARFAKAKEARHGYEYESLAPTKKDRVMEPFIVTLHPAASDETSSHDGQEFIFVLEGEMEVRINDTREVLKPGDSVYYDSASMHMVRAYGDKPAKILAVLVS